MLADQVLLPPITNRESMTLPFEEADADTGALLDLTGMTIQFEIRCAAPGYGLRDSPWYDGNVSPVLSASVGNGITITGLGTFTVYFSETSMATLAPGTYNVGCTLRSADGVDVRQILRGRLPVLDGYVTT